MNTAELTAMNAETLNVARIARTLANISRRAQTLFTDGGYTVNQYTENLFVVTNLQGDKYTVWHGVETGYSCGCKCFAELTTCKHLEAVDLIKQDAAQDAEKVICQKGGADVVFRAGFFGEDQAAREETIFSVLCA